MEQTLNKKERDGSGHEQAREELWWKGRCGHLRGRDVQSWHCARPASWKVQLLLATATPRLDLILAATVEVQKQQSRQDAVG